jgi:hypothetical protein
MLWSYPHRRPCRTPVNCQLNYSAISSVSLTEINWAGCPNSLLIITPWCGPCRQHPISPVACIPTVAGTCLSSSSYTVVEAFLLHWCKAMAAVLLFALRSLPSNESTGHNILLKAVQPCMILKTISEDNTLQSLL